MAEGEMLTWQADRWWRGMCHISMLGVRFVPLLGPTRGGGASDWLGARWGRGASMPPEIEKERECV